jgi:hypothetical protein
VAGLVAYLMSDGGSWINGQVINVDGGIVMRWDGTFPRARRPGM